MCSSHTPCILFSGTHMLCGLWRNKSSSPPSILELFKSVKVSGYNMAVNTIFSAVPYLNPSSWRRLVPVASSKRRSKKDLWLDYNLNRFPYNHWLQLKMKVPSLHSQNPLALKSTLKIPLKLAFLWEKMVNISSVTPSWSHKPKDLSVWHRH